MLGMIKQLLDYLWRQWGNNNPQGIIEHAIYFYYQWIVVSGMIALLAFFFFVLPGSGKIVSAIVQTFFPSVDSKTFSSRGVIRFWVVWCIFFWATIPLYFLGNWLEKEQSIRKKIKENESKIALGAELKRRRDKIEAKAKAKEEKAKAKAEAKAAKQSGRLNSAVHQATYVAIHKAVHRPGDGSDEN